ncbi:hypothetical protein KC951_03895 [Candidatus Saccharibacteria bacterium]|nr:hypothetical protein [Candidatus Saccharibacteria bacterium]
MKNLLVQMSRNSKLMIPVVGIVAMSLFIGGYIIRDGQITNRKEAEQQAETANKAPDNLTQLEQEQKTESTEQTANETATSTEKEQETEESKKTQQEVAKVSVAVRASASTDAIAVVGTLGTDKAGTCTVTVTQKGVKLASETNRAVNGECTITIPRPETSGEIKIQLTYAATDLSAKGIGDQTITL